MTTDADPGPLPRVAVVGCGLWGRNHVRNYAALGALAAVCDLRPAALQLAAEYGVPARSFADIAADPAIEAVALALPPSQNHGVGLRALRAGKHLFVEKPMAITIAEAEELNRAAERAGRVLMVGHILQYHPAFLALKDLVEAGRLGPLLRIESTRLDLGRIRREEDALWALAPHDLSMILALAGSAPDSVSAAGGYGTHRTVADTAALELSWPGGLSAGIRVSWLHPFKEQRLVAIGEAASAVFDDREDWARKLVLHRHRITPSEDLPTVERGEPEPVPLTPAEPLRAECLHFLRCIRDRSRPRTDGPEGLRVLQVLERASAVMGAERTLPPSTARRPVRSISA